MCANNTQMMGTDFAFPNVNLTPTPTPTPVTYPSFAMGPMFVPGGTWNILFCGTPAHNMASTAAMTIGDIAGVALGVASGTVSALARHLTGAFSFLLKGTPATRLMSQSLQNLTNAVGMRVAPSQFKIWSLCA